MKQLLNLIAILTFSFLMIGCQKEIADDGTSAAREHGEFHLVCRDAGGTAIGAAAAADLSTKADLVGGLVPSPLPVAICW